MTARAPLPPLYGDRSRWALIQAESIVFLKKLPAGSIDAIVVDPPYGIGFGGADWDGGAGNRSLSSGEGFERFSESWARQALRVLRPGGHMVSFAATRQEHRLTAGLEDAGFEIRDRLAWLFATGLPKSRKLPGGMGTALKPAYEPIVLARKPRERVGGKPLATAVHQAIHGTGALYIDAARIARPDRSEGLWPANVTLGHSDDCGNEACADNCPLPLIDQLRPGAPLSRMFFAAKASVREREAGLEGLAHRAHQVFAGSGTARPRRANTHTTVKPLSLMRWLVRLIAPPGAVVLDPFTGSGSTGCAVLLAGEGRQFIGIEREEDYVRIARARLAHWAEQSRRDGSEDGRSEL